MDYTMNKKVRSRNGNRDDTMAPHNCYRCQGEDKWISIAVDNENEWNSLCSAMGNPDWCRNGKFSAARLRKQHEDELDSLISEWTIKHSHYEIMNILQSAGVAAVPSLSNQEIYDDPHLNERDFAATLEHSVIGKQSVLNPPWKLSETPAKVSLPGPLLGEHNDYVLGELLGLSADEIAQLKEEKVVY